MTDFRTPPASFERTELTAALSDQWDALAAVAKGLPEDRWRTPSPLPGWSVFDVLAHVVGIESMLLGETPPPIGDQVRGFDHVRNEVGALNEAWLQALRPLSGEQLLRRFDEVTDRRRTMLTTMDDTAWQVPTPSPVGNVPYGRFMRVRVFDCWMHELDIADALGATVAEGGPRAELAVDEIADNLGRVLVKRGQAPKGSRITLELTGPVVRILHVSVDNRAELVPALDRPADVVLRLGSGLLARLGGGRIDPGAHAARIEIAGDTELGRRLAGNLAFTI